MDAPQRRRLRKELESLCHDSGSSTSKPTASSSSSSSLLAEQFAQQGWVSLGSILTPAEVQHWQRVYDRDRSEDAAGRWVGGGVQSLNYDVLLSSPEFHQLVRHPTILAALQDLMAPGEQPALGEISLRHMQPSSAADPSAGVHQEWHRDHPHAERRRHRTGYFTLMLYLSDVDEHTPCFSISPEASDDKLLPAPQQLAARGFQDLQGPAGTAILFNLSVLHRASGHARTVARSTKERKSLQLYYTHRHYQAGDRGTPSSWADEMRRWRVERAPAASGADSSSDTTQVETEAGGDGADSAAEGDAAAGAEAPGVNVDPDPGPTEETLIAAAHAEVRPSVALFILSLSACLFVYLPACLPTMALIVLYAKRSPLLHRSCT